MSINLKKNAREIGRHLRNRKWEQTPGGILIDRGGMNALMNGAFIDTLNGEDPQLSPNLVVNQGLIHVLNTVFAGAAQVTQWYIGLFSGNVTPQPNWTAANVVANATELTGYAPSTRPGFTVAPVSAPSLGNTGSEANFAFDASGPYIARGAFLISVSNKGSTTGVLMAATRFAADRAGLNSPDELGVRYVLTAADAGP
ncbi:MAG: hypothetical protein KA775_07370 [Ottowia sp.]|nr:hypothetical protein [Ottowia sp.]